MNYEAKIGSGGFGTVHRATWLSMHETVAVKQLHLKNTTLQIQENFFRELTLLHSLRSPYIVNIYGACTEPDRYALVMEYMPLGSLFKVLHEDHCQLSWPEQWSIGLQIAKGVNYLHQLSPAILHRDIKSANFLLRKAHEGYDVKVCDFGLSQIRNQTSLQSSNSRVLVCTLQWTAPEILRLQRHTEKSDIYSIGIVYWELATTEIPYEGCEDGAIRESVKAGDRLEIPSTVPLQFSDIIKQCWAHEPNDRPNSSSLVQLVKAHNQPSRKKTVLAWSQLSLCVCLKDLMSYKR